jgi:hypothetical protein
MSGHTCVYTRTIEQWTDGKGNRWIRLQCNQCDNQEVRAA